jgi:hypothetical protein
MLPTDASVKFIVCEVAREDVGNKVSLLGVFPDGKIRLPADARFPAAFPLTLVFFLLDGQGPFQSTIELLPPAPHPPFRALGPNVQKPADQAGTVLLTFTPFVAGGFGTYEVNLILDNQKYTREFQVSPAPTETLKAT